MKQLCINGVWADGTGLRTWAVTNPAPGEHLEDVAESLRDSEEPQSRCGVSLGEADLRGGVQREALK